MIRYVHWLVLAASAPGSAQVVSYECTSLPDKAGFERVDAPYPTDRWIQLDGDESWFYQQADIVDSGPPILSEEDVYRYGIGDFANGPSDGFFVEWVVETDGPREGIPNVSPAALVVGGQSAVFYHFTIARDQVLLIDTTLTARLIDIKPDVPHTYRLELRGTKSFVWFIDGEIAVSGVPEGPYPTPSSRITFGARAAGGEETTRWARIRFGVIPEPGSGDWESDGDVDVDDFYFLHECITNGGPGVDAGPGCIWTDLDSDGDVDFHDFRLFQLNFTVPD